MMHPSSVLTVVAGLLLATPSLINATPLPYDHSDTPKARIVSISARQTRTYDSMDNVKREVQSMRKRTQRFHEKMERSGVQAEGPMLTRYLNPVAPQPYDIGQTRRRAKTKRQGSATDPLNNYMDKSEQNFLRCIVILVLSTCTNGTEVYGDLSVGTPSQTITVEFDTGSSDLLVPVSDCKGCVSPFFDTRKSSTFSDLNQPFNTSFGSGAEASGYLASDTVSLGDLSVENQIFAIINNATGDLEKPNSGLIGFAFQAAGASHATPWFFNLANEGKLASNVASFYISRQEAPGSEACIGCMDSSKFTGDPEYFPLSPGNSSQALWTIVVSRCSL